MSATVPLRFAEFVLDPGNAQLWRDGRCVALRPKAFDVLRYLAEHPDRLVRKEEILAAVWPGLVVGDASLQGCLSEIRKVLGESPQAPRFVETVHRRGYRMRLDPERSEPAIAPCQAERPPVVGRDGEIGRLTQLLRLAEQGRRQTVFVSGEAGIGKTTLVESFLAEVAKPGACWVARGQCLTQFGPEVAYLPIFDSLACLAAEAPARVVPVLRASAPAWVVQMAGLMTEAERDAQRPFLAGASTERLLREFAEALETLGRQRVVVLWLDDLHDCDTSTLELLGYLARRKTVGRLLVIGTYRPAELATADHPLRKLDLALRERSLATPMPLSGLDAPALERYLRARLPARSDGRSWRTLAARLLARTEGNPLFVAYVVDHLLDLQPDASSGSDGDESWFATIPPKLDDMLGAQIAALSKAEREALDVASVVGVRFALQTVGAITGASALEVEAVFERLADVHRLVVRDGSEEWPDGTLALHYRFRHALHQEAAYRRVAPLRCAQLHGQIARHKEQSHAADLASVAVELASHFECSRDDAPAVRYALIGFDQALQRSAFAEGLKLVKRGLKLLQRLPEGAERDQSELRLRTAAAVSFATTGGAASSEAGDACRRALQLCRQADDSIELFPVLSGLFAFHLVDARYLTAEELGARLLLLAERQRSPVTMLAAHVALGMVRWHLGKLDEAHAHFEQRRVLYTAQCHLKYLQFGHDPTVTSLSFAAPVHWYLGFPDRARRAAEEGVELARTLGHAYSRGVALLFGARAFQESGDLSRVAALVEEHEDVCRERHFNEADARRMLTRGWLQARQGQGVEAIASLEQGLAECARFGTRLEKPYHLTILADAQARAGFLDAGLRTLAEALELGQQTGETYYRAEMHRLKAEMLFEALRRELPRAPLPGTLEEVETALQQALDLSRRQLARSLELRAAMSLLRWRQWCASNTGGVEGAGLESAHRALRSVVDAFTEGRDTEDLKNAERLLGRTGSLRTAKIVGDDPG